MKKLAILMLLVVGVVVLAWAFWPRQQGGDLPDSGDSSGNSTEANKLAEFVRGVSLLENLKADEALQIFNDLLQDDLDAAVLQNKIIALLTKIDNINGRIALNETTAEEKQSLRAEFPGIFEQLDKSLATAMELEPNNVELARLAVMAETKRIDQLPNTIAASMRRTLLDKILKYVEQFPGDPILTAKLMFVVESLKLRDESLEKLVTEPLQAAYEANPRNAFLLRSLILRKIELRDPSLVDLVEPAIEIARPVDWLMRSSMGGQDISQSLREAAAKFQTEPDEFFETFLRWANTLLGTPRYRVDSKRTDDISPLVMVRIQNAYERFAVDQTRVAKDLSISDLEPDAGQAWQSVAIINNPETVKTDEITQLQLFDWNIDLQPELLMAQNQTVQLYGVNIDNETNTLDSMLAAIEIDAPINTIVPVDLFEVQSSSRRQIHNMPLGDIRHSTLRDLVVGTSSGIRIVAVEESVPEGLPRLSLVDSSKTGLPLEGNVAHVTPLDFEADGDLDLAMVIDGRVHLFMNRGARNFLEADSTSDMPPSDRKVSAIAACDYDHDVDIDIMISFEDGVGVLENIQHGQFVYRDLTGEWSVLADASNLQFADFDGNVSWDWVATKKDQISVLRTTTIPGKDVLPSTSVTINAVGLTIAFVRDFDLDARQDLLVSHQTGVDVLWQNSTDEFGFQKKTSVVEGKRGLAAMIDNSSAQHAATIVVKHPEALMLYKPTLEMDGSFVSIRIKGISDNGGGNNNEYAIGAMLELFSPDSYQSRSVTAPSTIFGVGENVKPYSLRIIFPNGLTQTVLDPKLDEQIEIKQELKGSCPFLYGFDGEKWQLITDCLWNAPLGLQVERGKVLPGRRWEYLSLPRQLMQPYKGAYEIRLTEELWEAAYFDQVELLVFDHPAESFVLTNEKVGPDSIAMPGLWTYEKSIKPAKITDAKGRDWTEQMKDYDGQVAVPFDEYICQGLVNEHYLEIELPQTFNVNGLQLVLSGWLCPTDTSLNIGIGQNPHLTGPVPPSIVAVDDSGTEELITDFMGFPGGKPKTIVVDLSGKIASSTKSIRIKTSAELYWDQAYFIEGSNNSIQQAVALELDSADLQFRGFSALMPRERSQPHWYDYQNVSTQPKWLPMSGLYTRYGNCREIIAQDDDHMVVMGSGDELVVRFAMPAEPVKKGYVRDFILHNVGWDKDADLNTITGQSSLPLPFKAMQSYPSPATQREQLLEVERLNADTLTREQSFQAFWKETLREL